MSVKPINELQTSWKDKVILWGIIKMSCVSSMVIQKVGVNHRSVLSITHNSPPMIQFIYSAQYGANRKS